MSNETRTIDKAVMANLGLTKIVGLEWVTTAQAAVQNFAAEMTACGLGQADIDGLDEALEAATHEELIAMLTTLLKGSIQLLNLAAAARDILTSIALTLEAVDLRDAEEALKAAGFNPDDLKA